MDGVDLFVLETFRDKLFTDIFPGRTEVPKTLVFAKTDPKAGHSGISAFLVESLGPYAGVALRKIGDGDLGYESLQRAREFAGAL